MKELKITDDMSLNLINGKVIIKAKDYPKMDNTELVIGEKEMNKTITINATEHDYLVANGYFEQGEVVSIEDYNKAVKHAEKELEEGE